MVHETPFVVLRITHGTGCIWLSLGYNQTMFVYGEIVHRDKIMNNQPGMLTGIPESGCTTP